MPDMTRIFAGGVPLCHGKWYSGKLRYREYEGTSFGQRGKDCGTRVLTKKKGELGGTV